MERQELLEKNRGLSRKCLPLHKLFHQHLEKQWKGQEGHLSQNNKGTKYMSHSSITRSDTFYCI